MHHRLLFKTAVRGLSVNRTRSLLTILGIIIGITSVTLVVSVSEGANSLVVGQFRAFGSRTIATIAGREPRGPADFAEFFTDSLKDRELEALSDKENVPTLENIYPQVIVPGGSISFEGETFRGTVVGSSYRAQNILDLELSDGDFFDETDIESRAFVTVIGQAVREELFGLSDPIGRSIKVKGKNFRVVGVITKKGSGIFFNIDELVILPYSTAQKYLLGQDHYTEIIGQATTEEAISQTVSDIKATLRELHRITDPEKDDFHVETQAGAAETVGMITGILTALLASVAAISLLVGGIGIMNIMLVSVTERTREIGLRKAIGATNKDIRNQFLLEAIGLTVTGGILGILLGTILSFIASSILSRVLGLSWPFSLPFTAAFLGFLVSFFVGLIFGIYPARKASQKSPIEALRYE